VLKPAFSAEILKQLHLTVSKSIQMKKLFFKCALRAKKIAS